MGRERLMHAFKNARLIDCIYYSPHFSSSFKIKYGDRTDENTERPNCPKNASVLLVLAEGQMPSTEDVWKCILATLFKFSCFP